MQLRLEPIEYKALAETLAKFAKALEHPNLISILKHLKNQSCRFTRDLVDILPISQSKVTQHLKELKNTGLIQGELKPSKIKYRINQDNWIISKSLFQQFFD
jgi:ArsR family transcriptional regulator